MTEAVVVGGASIGVERIHREAQYHPARSFGEACHEATRALVIRELLLQEAGTLGLCDAPHQLSEREVHAVIERLLDRTVPVPQISQEECQRYYEQETERFLGPELFEASHILFAAPKDAGQRELARARAALAIAELMNAPERFERLAREHSACPSAASGGRLGQVSPGETVAEFEAVLRTLEPGQLHREPVETAHGFHVIRLDERSGARQLPFSAVEMKLRLYLRERAWRKELADYISRLATRVPVIGFDLHAPPPTEEAVPVTPRSGRAATPSTDARRRLPLLS